MTVVKQILQSSGGIVGSHERLTDQEGVESSATQQFDVGVGGDATFTHAYNARWHEIAETERGVERDVEGIEIAVIDANEFGAGIDRFGEFVRIVDLN